MFSTFSSSSFVFPVQFSRCVFGCPSSSSCRSYGPAGSASRLSSCPSRPSGLPQLRPVRARALSSAAPAHAWAPSSDFRPLEVSFPILQNDTVFQSSSNQIPRSFRTSHSFRCLFVVSVPLFILRASVSFCAPNARPRIRLPLRQPALPRKEVIQPHLPIRLPCYDFTPVIGLTFDGCALSVHSPASGAPNSHGVTGGVYKARERIHRGMLIRDY